jgi:hydrogenase-1 operon protein HyaE
MTTALVRALTERHGLSVVDETNIDAFLSPTEGESSHAALFFAGAGQKRGETGDLAVVFPEILRSFAGRLRGAVVAPEAEASLKSRFQVFVFPSLAIARGLEPVGVLPKILDWSEYRDKIEGFLDPAAPVLAGPQGPKTVFTHSQGA